MDIVWLLLLGGVFIMIKGKIRASKTKVLPAKTSRIIGGLFIFAALLHFLLVPIGTILMIIIVVCSCLYGIFAAKNES